MKANKWVVVMLTAVASLALPSSASAKTAKCEITSYPSDKYVGPCEFSSRKGGSFEVLLPEQAAELIFTRYIYINITAPGRGVIGVAGGTGRTSEWGRVQRDPKKPACWFGEWGRVCVY